MSDSINERLRDLFTEMGGNVRMRDLAREAIARGFWPEDVLDGAKEAWATKRARDAMRQAGPSGAPFAAPVEKGSHPQWRQLELIDTPEEANFIIRERIDQERADNTVTHRIADYFRAKLGGGIISVPTLMG